MTARPVPLEPLQRLGFTRSELLRLAALYGAIALVHGLGGGLALHYAARFPSLVALGLTAYLLGLRHAFDADHIVAIDDTVRYLLQKQSRPLGVGFFFSMGHSTIVFVVATAAALAAARFNHQLPVLQQIGAFVGGAVSATFLCLIGLLNLAILLDLIAARRGLIAPGRARAHAAHARAPHGILTLLFGQGWLKIISHSWHMYLVGLLFGVGFDTASEIALIVITAESGSTVPLPAVLSLPLLFAAGMLAVDSTDGVLMARAYSWALSEPIRKLTFNIVLTAISATVALVIGTIQGAQLLSRLLNPAGTVPAPLDGVASSVVGLLIVVFLLVAWGLSALMSRRPDRRARA